MTQHRSHLVTIPWTRQGTDVFLGSVKRTRGCKEEGGFFAARLPWSLRFATIDAVSSFSIEGSLFGLETTVDVKGKYIGGTGKFKGIRGSTSLKEKRTQAEVTVGLETENEVR